MHNQLSPNVTWGSKLIVSMNLMPVCICNNIGHYYEMYDNKENREVFILRDFLALQQVTHLILYEAGPYSGFFVFFFVLFGGGVGYFNLKL